MTSPSGPHRPTASTPLLTATNLSKRFPVGKRQILKPDQFIRAVDHVNLHIRRGRTLALVGESGSGKTTLGHMVSGLLPPSEGSIEFDGQPLDWNHKATMRSARRHLQVVFQDPYSSLNPRHTVRTILSRPFLVHTDLAKEAIEGEIKELLGLVGLTPAHALLDRYPHQFSGGQRQRLVLARAIALRPSLIVADEPVSALDMSVKAQLLTLLQRFQAELNLTYLFITHELAVARTIAHDVAVMYLGRIVEFSEIGSVFDAPLHPYTRALLSSTPTLNPHEARSRERINLTGAIPSPVSPPPGCHFNTRCPYARPVCSTETPTLRQIGSRSVACHFVGDPNFPLTHNLPSGLAEQARSQAKPFLSAA